MQKKVVTSDGGRYFFVALIKKKLGKLP